MISMPSAKILLFIGLALGPKGAPTVYATSNSEAYIWNLQQTGWTVEARGFPASDFTREPEVDTTLPLNHVPDYLKQISQHDWSHNSVMIFDNGDRVEKDGDHAFYIINAGAPNQKVYTILFPTNS